MAMSYNYLINRPFHVDPQAVTACYTLIVQKSHLVLEFFSSEWASYQCLLWFLVIRIIKKKKKAGLLEQLVCTQ